MFILITDFFNNRLDVCTEEQRIDLYQLITHEILNLIVIIAVSIMFNYKITIPVIMFSALTHANNKIKYDLKYDKSKMQKILNQKTLPSIIIIILGVIFIYILPAWSTYIIQHNIADSVTNRFKFFYGIAVGIAILVLSLTNKLHQTVSWLIINVSQPLVIFYISKFLLYTLFSRIFLFVKNLSDATHFENKKQPKD